MYRKVVRLTEKIDWPLSRVLCLFFSVRRLLETSFAVLVASNAGIACACCSIFFKKTVICPQILVHFKFHTNSFIGFRFVYEQAATAHFCMLRCEHPKRRVTYDGPLPRNCVLFANGTEL